MTPQEATASWRAERASYETAGAYAPPTVSMYATDELKRNFLAMDAAPPYVAQPGMTTDPNSGIPWFLTNLIDPMVYKILFTPNKAADIFGEVRKGTWLDQTAMFPVAEHTGEVTTYGDYSESGSAGVNTNWPQRQAYLFQIMKEYGELELERAGLGRINWVSELDAATATMLNKFHNLTYFFGVMGLQNYGLFNDPNLSASLTPAIKAYGGVKWINNGVVVAQANEVFTDIQSVVLQLVNQTNGLVDAETPMTLAMSPQSKMALTATNSFNVNVSTLMKDNFPNMKIDTAIQYQATSVSNPQGVAAGNFMQLFAKGIEGQDTGYCAFNEKMRAHAIIRATSSFKQKVTGGTWGAIIRMPVAVSSMVGM